MERKFKLRGRRERIIEDWTWKDEMEVGGNSKSGGGKRKLRGYRKLRMEGQWWIWDEKGEVLRDGTGKVWGVRQGGVNNGGNMG